MANLEFWNGTSWVVIAGGTGSINLTGDIVGSGFTNGVTQTSFNVTTDFNVTNHKVINIKDPEVESDAASANWVWNLLNDNVSVEWL